MFKKRYLRKMANEGIEPTLLLSISTSVEIAPSIEVALGKEVLSKLLMKNYDRLAHDRQILWVARKKLAKSTKALVEDILDLVEEKHMEDCLNEVTHNEEVHSRTNKWVHGTERSKKETNL